MKFTCLTENLAQGLAVVSKAVSTKGSLPILSHVLLATDQGRLKLGATDLDTGMLTWVGGKVEAEGSLTVPAKLLWELISQLSAGKVTLEAQEQTLTLKTIPSQTHSLLYGLSAEEFPPLPETGGDFLFELDPKDLSSAVNQVAFAAAVDESRPVLTGVLLKQVEKNLCLVGVDGFRLAEKKISLATEASRDFNLVVPARTLLEIARICPSCEDPVRVQLLPDENQVVFFLGDVRVISRLLEGQFPDYEKIIPASFTLRAKVATDEFLQAVRLAAVFARDSASVVKLSFDPRGVLSLSSNTQNVGEHRTEIAVEIEGEPLEIAFNSKYLADVLTNLGVGEVFFESSGPLNPGVFKPSVGKSDYLHLIMPVRVAE